MDASLQADIDMIGRIDIVPKILDSVRETTGMSFAAVARVVPGQCVACAVSETVIPGLEVGAGGIIDIGAAVCQRVRRTGEPIIVDCGAREAGSRDLPDTAGFESCFSFPVILRDGSFFGVLCAFDSEPRTLRGTPTAKVIALFAELIAAQIDDMMRLDETRRTLRDEKATADLREQFIAVLGHDLRNTVASLASGTRMLLQMPLGHNAITVVKLLQGSAVRMDGFTDTLLDLARGRLADGLTVRRSNDVPLMPVLTRAVQELSVTSGREIDARFDFDDPVNCDTARIGQLATNLIDNAARHGAPDVPVTVRAWREEGVFHLSVANGGTPIPEATQAELFLPFSRKHRENRVGTGLGLYIAAEIARRHRGEIACVSTPEETRFTLTMTA